MNKPNHHLRETYVSSYIGYKHFSEDMSASHKPIFSQTHPLKHLPKILAIKTLLAWNGWKKMTV